MSSAKSGTGNKEEGLANTAVSRIMKVEKIGGCSQQLYAQFLYRIIQMSKLFGNKILIGLFSPTLIFTGEHFQWFRNEGLRGHFVEGFIFQASEFADVAEGWAISFSLWDFTQSIFNPTKLKVKVLDAGGIINLYYKELYCVPKSKKVSNFYKSNTKEVNCEFATFSTGICMTSGIKKHDINSYGYLFMDTPRVEYNDQFVTLIHTQMRGNKIAIPIHDDNVLNCLSLFTARRLITKEYANWINCKDEYMIPNKNHPLYQQWVADCVVYSLFNLSSNFASMRGIMFNACHYNIYNHFFFMKIKEIKKLSLEYKNDEIFYDIENHSKEERFIVNILDKLNLSEDAFIVLQKARDLINESFRFRKTYNIKHPEYFINTWDAGWYQIRELLKFCMFSEYREFSALYRQLEDKTRPLVYEFGFLYK